MKFLSVFAVCSLIMSYINKVGCNADCSFSDINLCGYSNSFNGTNGPQWIRQRASQQQQQHHYYGDYPYTVQQIGKPPKGDYFMYTGPTESNILAEGLSQLSSPPIVVNTTGKCLYFAYYNRLPISLTPTLIVMKKDLNDSEDNRGDGSAILAEFYSSESSKWFEVQVPLPEGEYRLTIAGKNYNSRIIRGGHVAVTNIAIKDGPCAETVPDWLETPGDCGFEGSLEECGYSYTNDSSSVRLLQIFAESLPAQEQSQRSSRQPPDDRFLAMTSRFHEITNHGSKVRLLSPEIVIHREGCLYLWYYNSVRARNIESNVLNVIQLETTTDRLLFRLPISTTQRDRWYQLNGALPRGTYRVIIEVVYTSDFGENDYVGIDNVEVFNKSCPAVRLMADACQGDAGEERILCRNQASCVKTGKKSFRCVCRDGYYGNRCEHKYPCTEGNENNCMNRGSCTPDGKVDFRCQCQEGFSGKQCEQIVSCGTPAEAVRNARVIAYTNETYGSTVRFQCNEGWYRQGELVGTCTAQGRWQVQGKCLFPDCFQPPVQSQMTLISVTNTTLNGRATYRCREGLTTYENQDFLICEISPHYNMQWNVEGDRLPGRWVTPNTDFWRYHSYYGALGQWGYDGTSWLSCHPIPNCGQPPALRNANISVTNTLMYGIATYHCLDGYEMSMNLTLLELNCSQHGKWMNNEGISIESVQCLMLPDCGPPPEVPNAVVSYTNTTLHSTATYTCLNGYRLVEGSDTAHCWQVGENRLQKWIDWLFVPRCEFLCPVKAGRLGNFTTATFQVSHCTLSAFQTHSAELSCGPAVNYSLKRKQRRVPDGGKEDRIVFSGSELCFAESVTKLKLYENSVVASITKCASFCLQNSKDIRDVVVYEELVSSPSTAPRLPVSSSSSSSYAITKNQTIVRYSNLNMV